MEAVIVIAASPVGSKTVSSVSTTPVVVGVAVTVLVTVWVTVEPGAVTVVVPPGAVEVTVAPGAVEVTVVPGPVTVEVVPGAVEVMVVVSVSPLQAAMRIVEPMAAPPTSKPASFKKSRLDIPPDFFLLSSIILLYDLLFKIF